MCGRIALFTPPAHLARFLDAALAADLDLDEPPSWNVGPQRTLFAVTERDDTRVLDRYRWGLVPSWSKDPSVGNRLFNARGETVTEKPSFRNAFAKRPCAIPVDGFYEWDHRPGRNRQPHYFTRVDEAPLVFAGLYEFWRDDTLANAELLATCTIITTTPSEDMDELHDRMPVVLNPDDVETWINANVHRPDERQLLLRPAPAGTLTHYGVNTAVGSVKNDGPELTEPIESVEPQSLF
ncbi:MAG TPA: SOS response-associated peptidase [Acidimicrobiales bacterium]|nr:SOS response-associated peptidase [Acidimicrobiales bacterium]